MTALCLCLILRFRMDMSLCLCSGVLTCFSADYAYVTNPCAYALAKTSLNVSRDVNTFTTGSHCLVFDCTVTWNSREYTCIVDCRHENKERNFRRL